MQEPIVIDKDTYKVMRYIYRHKEISLQKIYKKFGQEGRDIAIYLCPKYYAACRDAAGKLTYDISSLSDYDLIGLTPAGKKYVEDTIACFTKWIIPTLISILALVISIATFIMSRNNEIVVHLLNG